MPTMSAFRKAGLAAGVASGLLVAACGDDGTGPGPLPAAFTSVAAGLIHSCGIVEGGALYCWGNNQWGQLGDGSLSSREAPVPVLGSLLLAAVSPGGGHTCGLTPQGKVYCWGFNLNGQLGDGTTANKTTPISIDAARTYFKLGAGASYTCGIAADSAAYCWGWNQFSQLGDGTASDRYRPTAVAGGHKFASISASSFHTCAVTSAGKAYCWGSNSFGQLGTGDTTASATPVEVQTGIVFAEVDVGFHHTCSRAVGGAEYCWGRNQWGQLGATDSLLGNSQFLPTPVDGGMAWTSLAAGANFSCGIEAQTEAGYCWGYNGWGQLGAEVPGQCLDQNGRVTECSATPYPVSGNVQFATISAATHHACGLSTQGVAYCWGLNEDGQLGNGQAGDNAFSIQPVRVSGQP